MIDSWGISCEIALIWISLDFTDNQSTLVQVMAWCRQATSHYLSQCGPRSLSPYGVTRPLRSSTCFHWTHCIVVVLFWRYQIMDCFVKLNWFCAINDWYGTIVKMHVALPQVVRGSFRLPWLEPIPKFKWRCSKRHLWLNCFKRSSFQETRTFGFWSSKVSVIWVSHKDPFCRLSQVRWELSQPMREDVTYVVSSLIDCRSHVTTDYVENGPWPPWRVHTVAVM